MTEDIWLKFWTEVCEGLWHDSKVGTNIYEPPWVVSNIMKKYEIKEIKNDKIKARRIKNNHRGTWE